jgi:hypothetical protein
VSLSYNNAYQGAWEAYNGKDHANEPHTHGVDGSRDIVGGFDDRTHFGEGRIVGLIGKDFGCIPIQEDGRGIIGWGILVDIALLKQRTKLAGLFHAQGDRRVHRLGQPARSYDSHPPEWRKVGICPRDLQQNPDASPEKDRAWSFGEAVLYK